MVKSVSAFGQSLNPFPSELHLPDKPPGVLLSYVNEPERVWDVLKVPERLGETPVIFPVKVYVIVFALAIAHISNSNPAAGKKPIGI